MSRRSVRAYLDGILDDHTDLTVRPSIPKAEGLADHVMIESITSREERRAFPRGGGRKWVKYTVLYSVMTSDPDEEAATSRLDDMLTEITHSLRSTDLNVTLTDSTISETSYVREVGETIEVVMNRLESLAVNQGDEADVLALALVSVSLSEEVIA